MGDICTLGRLEGRLLGHLAAALANHLVQMEGLPGPVQKGDTFFHSYQTAFEMAADALEAIGVCVPRTTSVGQPDQAFVANAAEMPAFLAEHSDDESAAKLFEAFVLVACGYAGLCDSREWFDAPSRWEEAMRYLTLAGYAERDADLFRWTDKIGPAMRSTGHWNEDDQSLAVLRNVQREADAKLAWQTMPDTLRQSLRSSSISFMEVVKILALSWRDGQWRPFNRDSPVGPHLSGKWEMAEWLMERARRP